MEVSTTTPADPYAVPAVIDIQYVNRVLAALYKIDGDVLRSVLSRGTPGPEDLRPLRAIYDDPQYDLEARGLLRLFQEDEGKFKTPPGDRRVLATRLLKIDSQCIVAEVHSDFSAVVTLPTSTPPDQADFVVLVPTRADADPDQINPTPWSITDAERLEVGKVPDRPCE